jgi:ApaG protein
MEILITEGIKISVVAFYEPAHSSPVDQKFLFSYRITIENLSKHQVQLLSRHWRIVDAFGKKIMVDGDGVIGQQPVLEPGQVYSYRSWCPLRSEMGKMGGYYSMIRTSDDMAFNVTIPTFRLLAPFYLN